MRESNPADLVGTVEIARHLGISRQRVDKLSRSDDFPAPAADLAVGRVWHWGEVEAWARRTGRINTEEAG